MPKISKSLQQMRLLAVDDNQINRRFLMGVLTDAVAELQVVGSGAEAIEVGKAQNWDVLLLDLHMPDNDGVQVWRALYDHYQSTSQPQPLSIVITADVRKTEQDRLLGIGFDGFIGKPVSGEQLLTSIEAINQHPGVALHQTIPGYAGTNEIDDTTALKALNNDVELLHKMRQKFVAGLPTIINSINNHAAGGAWSKVADDAHKLAGGCAYVGAHALAGQCDRLQSIVRDHQDTDQQTRPDQLVAAHLRLRQHCIRTGVALFKESGN